LRDVSSHPHEDEAMTYTAASDRYAATPYRRSGASGVRLPTLSLGLWHNFGDTYDFTTQRAVLRRAFDLGITHFDLANNYGPPYGSAETDFGRHLRADFVPYRDELFIATKAGYDMWPGPYGDGGSRKYLLASLDQSLKRTGLDYVDVFYSHRPDLDVPLAETVGALVSAVQQGKALYAGISNYRPDRTAEAAQLLAEAGVPLLIHQARYSMLDRWVEDGLLDSLEKAGAGCIAFSPLAQGLLTDRYLNGTVPRGSRMSVGHFLTEGALTSERLGQLRALAAIAADRGQSLAELAITWLLRDDRVTSVLIGASSVEQLEQNHRALAAPAFSAVELEEIERVLAPAGP
jgi:L-glyceraldehyde 3-phosphate reductase